MFIEFTMAKFYTLRLFFEASLRVIFAWKIIRVLRKLCVDDDDAGVGYEEGGNGGRKNFLIWIFSWLKA